MKVKFIGAIKGVTGSCSLLHHEKSDTKLLIDCGGFIEGERSEWINNQDFSFNPKELKYVFLTHAHYDHCGLIPKLYKLGFIGEVYCTRATAELAKIILDDSQKHTCIYDNFDVRKIKFKYVDSDPRFGWGKPISLEPDLRVTFLRSSHILGATSIQVNWGINADNKGKSINFSGDIGTNTDDLSYLPLLKPNQYPFPSTNYLVVESTYGGRNRTIEHKSALLRRERLKTIVEEVVLDGHGKLLIPVFAVHRAQEICADLQYVMEHMIDKKQVEQYLKTRKNVVGENLKVCIDSSMLAKANKVYSSLLVSKTNKGKYQYLSDLIEPQLNDFIKLLEEGYYRCKNIKCFFKVFGLPTKSSKNKKAKVNYDVERKEHRVPSSSIIIASSGMCDSGPIKEYLDLLKSEEENAILFTGFLSKGSVGQKIKDKEIEYFKGSLIDMSAYYSGHADEEGIVDFVYNIGGRESNSNATIFINHGTNESKEKLKQSLERESLAKCKGKRTLKNIVTLNGSEGWYDLDKGDFIIPSDPNILIEQLLNRVKILENVVLS